MPRNVFQLQSASLEKLPASSLGLCKGEGGDTMREPTRAPPSPNVIEGTLHGLALGC